MPQRTAPHDTQAPELETPRRAAASHASVGADGIPIEAILMTASGCGVMVKDHGHLLAHDSAYATKAARISALTLDLSEALARFEPELSARLIKPEGRVWPTIHPARYSMGSRSAARWSAYSGWPGST